MSKTYSRRKQLATSLGCVAVFLLAVCLVHPSVELATDDDWSYAQTARAFAQTGHFVYNGWATAMLGWQVVWGALFIKLFGFSFFVLRASTIVLAAMTAFVLHRVLLRFGVGLFNSAVGTLTVVLCPLFVPMAASFMTDVPCVLCLLVCIYGCQRALRSEHDKTALLWLCGSAALNVVDGTVRQVAWLGALVMIPSVFWLLRRRRGFVVAGVVTWIVSLIGVLLFVRWFQLQPYSLPEHILGGPVGITTLLKACRALANVTLDVALFVLPILAAWLPSLMFLKRRSRSATVIFFVCLGPLLLAMDHFGQLRDRLPPWTPNIVSKYGIFWSVPSLGSKTEVMDRGFLTLMLVLLVSAVWAFVVSRYSVHRAAAVTKALSNDSLTLRETEWLLAPFCVCYVMALLPRAVFPGVNAGLYDRYYIPLVLMAVILLLRLYEAERGGPLPSICVVVLSIFSLFSIAGTHDMFVEYRAVNAAIQEVRAANIPATSISGGWVYDGWTQIEAEGYINDTRLVRPAGAYRRATHPPLENCKYWFGPVVPALHPRYVVVASPLGCLQPSQFPDVTYATWLPPYSRRLLVERNATER